MVGDTRFRVAEAIARAQNTGSTPMLDRIDLHGTLELSWDEMPQFLAELAQLVSATVNDQEREVLEALQRLSEGVVPTITLPFGWPETEGSSVIKSKMGRTLLPRSVRFPGSRRSRTSPW
jgi:hypothetical protein